MLEPWRTGMPGRPTVDLASPWHDRRPRKRWRWVGVFADDVLLCAAIAHVGPIPVSWWAVWDRGHRTLTERTVKRRGPVLLPPGQVRVPGIMDLAFDETPGVETISPGPIWTRKQVVRITGTVGDRTIDCAGIVDDSAGYHPRDTRWRWSAGVGETTDGTAVAWNLVAGLHDDPRASERTLWLDGEPHQLEPQPFAADLTAVGDLRFHAETTRVHKENRILVATDYEQPFGRFRGTLPIAGELTGLGVMERHAARW